MTCLILRIVRGLMAGPLLTAASIAAAGCATSSGNETSEVRGGAMRGYAEPSLQATPPVPTTGRMRTTSAATAPAPGAPITASATSRTEFTRVVTGSVSLDQTAIACQWNGILLDGAGSFGGGATGRAAGSFELESGEIYIDGTTTPSFSQPVMQAPAAYPIVITRGGVQAGSVGTDWYCWVNGDTLYVVLLHPTNSTVGPPVTLPNTWLCARHSSGSTTALQKSDTFVTIDARGVISPERSVDSDAALKARVNTALAAASDARLR